MEGSSMVTEPLPPQTWQRDRPDKRPNGSLPDPSQKAHRIAFLVTGSPFPWKRGREP